MAAGALAVATEALPGLGFSESASAAWFRNLIVLAALLLVAAALLQQERQIRSFKEHSARVLPVIEAFLLGVGVSDNSDVQQVVERLNSEMSATKSKID